ncbi:Cation efflux transporter [uncultured Desulfobacterium sp.]|uniref:Cation efflux transporter n=1 Tax=uncultured Desulfobacterium sp. TaxID=201089 RepID=A0A445MZ58_9BACT|nr:Cation efflux transporter [uncultured Desulfobacterium sp.]
MNTECSHTYHNNSESFSSQRKMLIVLLITSVIMVAEVIGGLLANSLALLSDAGHMLTDVLALFLSMTAMKFAQRPPTLSKTYGFYRLEILAALCNGILLTGISIVIFLKAYDRFLHPEAIKGLYMLGVAVVGLVANGAGIVILGHAARKNLNVKSAFFHLVGDTISSAGVILGGVIIVYTGWYVIDSIIGFLIGLLILRGAYVLVKEAVDIFLEATPKEIDLEKLVNELRGIEGVRDIHHIHLWTITTGIHAISAHVLIDDLLTSKSALILREIKRILRNNYSMAHTTIEFESESCGDGLLKGVMV